MRRLALALFVCLTFTVAFGGTVSGYLVFECSEPAGTVTGLVTVFNISFIGSGDMMDVPYSTTFPPDWSFAVSGDFCDDSAYYAFAGVMVDGAFGSGYPMGMYPESPFHTSGGSAEGIVIPVDDTVDLPVVIHPVDVEFEDVYLNVYDALPVFFTGEPAVLEMTVPFHDTFQVVGNVPAGPKYLQVFKDIDGDSVWDEGIEPDAYYESPESNLVFATGGFSDTVEITFSGEGIAGCAALREPFLRASPNPFNAWVVISAGGFDGSACVEIVDASGRVVFRRSVFPAESFVWTPQGLPSGTYVVRLSCPRRSVWRRIAFVK